MTPIQPFPNDVFYYLTFDERDMLTKVNKQLFEQIYDFITPYYRCLDSIMDKCQNSWTHTSDASKQELQIVDTSGMPRRVLINHCVGSGGAKKVFALNERNVIILPNLDNPIQSVWNRIVNEEIFVSQYLHKQNLITSFLQSVKISFPISGGRIDAIPGYICSSFKYLAEKQGCYIIEARFKEATWKRGKDFLFASHEERLNVDNWISVLRSLWKDIGILEHLTIGIGGDALNVAIIRNPASQNSSSSYVVRFFGLDFASKQTKLLKHPGFKKEDQLETFRQLLQSILVWEFSYNGGLKFKEQDELNDKICSKFTALEG